MKYRHTRATAKFLESVTNLNGRLSLVGIISIPKSGIRTQRPKNEVHTLRVMQMDIFDKIKELSLPQDAYALVGGGILVALGLLEWNEDIDICVTPTLFAYFQSQGWQPAEWAGKPVLKYEVPELISQAVPPLVQPGCPAVA